MQFEQLRNQGGQKQSSAQERQMLSHATEQESVSSKTGRRIWPIEELGRLSLTEHLRAKEVLVEQNPRLAPFLDGQRTTDFMQAPLPTHPTLLRNIQEGNVPMAMASPEDMELAKRWEDDGRYLSKDGKDEKALRAYDQAIKFNPQLNEAFVGKGLALCNLGRYEEAIAAYDEAIRLNPEFSSAFSGKGDALVMLGRYEEARAVYDEAIKLDPIDVSTFICKGDLLESLERYEEALAAYNEAIKLDPRNDYFFKLKGEMLNALERHEEAEEAFRKAKELYEQIYMQPRGRGISYTEVEQQNDPDNPPIHGYGKSPW